MTRAPLFVTVAEASSVFRCDERSVRRAIDAGELTAVRFGRLTRIPTTALAAMAGVPEHDLLDALHGASEDDTTDLAAADSPAADGATPDRTTGAAPDHARERSSTPTDHP